ncbi:MAG TPA: sigma-70 family RNA polymerase sigma factor [Chitinophagaceae bacterium]|nr:sigma-70 family RNA polymerase sigma factor [Chitinophagaceae bacterium]
MLNPEWKDNDQKLIEEFRSGNKKAFHYIYNLYYATLCSYANRLFMDNSQEAEDIVAESFIKLWERREQVRFEAREHIRAYLYTVIRNSRIDFLRIVQRKEESHKELFYLSEQDDEAYLQASMARAELYNKMLEEIERMPEGMKQIFLLAFVDGMSTAEIAQKLERAEETVRVQKARAVKFLKKRLGDQGTAGTILSSAIFAFLELMLNH